MDVEETAFCCRCKEEFPLAPWMSMTWQTGLLRPLKWAPKYIVKQFKEWLDHPTGKYLCGNCYFDLTGE